MNFGINFLVITPLVSVSNRAIFKITICSHSVSSIFTTPSFTQIISSFGSIFPVVTLQILLLSAPNQKYTNCSDQ